jgi:hypothetical protein
MNRLWIVTRTRAGQDEFLRMTVNVANGDLMMVWDTSAATMFHEETARAWAGEMMAAPRLVGATR